MSVLEIIGAVVVFLLVMLAFGHATGRVKVSIDWGEE
jgi:hypothetical protein